MSDEACSRLTRSDLERQFHTARAGRLFSGRPVPTTQQIERLLTRELLAVLRALRRPEESESGSINQADKAHRMTRTMPAARPMQKAGPECKGFRQAKGPDKEMGPASAAFLTALFCTEALWAMHRQAVSQN